MNGREIQADAKLQQVCHIDPCARSYLGYQAGLLRVKRPTLLEN